MLFKWIFFLLINTMYMNVLLAVDETLVPGKSQLSFLTMLVSSLNTGHLPFTLAFCLL